MEPGQARHMVFSRRRSLAKAAWALPAAPGLAALLLVAAGLTWGWFDRGGPGLLLLAAVTALATVFLMALYLELRGHLLTRSRRIAECEQTLRHLGPWDSDEGVLRKAGLVRELNALGAGPLDLEHAALAGADLTGCDLRGAHLRGADLRGANLQGALLDGADLSDADLTEATLALASLAGVTARGASFEGAALTKAKLAGADLTRANLVDANVHGAELRTATLERARFADAAPGEFAQTLHPSVDDWIRERLDARGCYSAEAQPGPAGRPPGKARAG